MPTYAYACRECHHRFEVVQSMNDVALSVCPRCEGSLRRVFEAVGVTFRGSGFYRTDSRRSGSQPDPGSTASTDAPTPQKESPSPSKS
jgi:putative FmdB family regulatory protein